MTIQSYFSITAPGGQDSNWSKQGGVFLYISGDNQVFLFKKKKKKKCDSSLGKSWRDGFNPIALRKAKIAYNFGLSECNRVNEGSQQLLGYYYLS